MAIPVPSLMPASLHDIFGRLRHLYLILRLKWKVYRQLFGTDKERIDLLNNIAPTAFWVWQETLSDEMDLALSRLTDPKESGKGKKKFDNLTLEKLIDEIAKVEPPGELRLMVAVSDVDGIPTESKNLVVVAAVNHALHFRIFDGDGAMIVDTDERQLTEQVLPIENLRSELAGMWPPHVLTVSEQSQVITAVAAIVGRDPPGSPFVQELHGLLKRLESECAKSRERRNKIVAHSDLSTNLGQTHAYVRPSRQEIEAALKTMETVLNTVTRYYGGEPLLYDHFIMKEDGDTLIAALRELQRRRSEMPRGGRP
jgi:hypothetical protein